MQLKLTSKIILHLTFRNQILCQGSIKLKVSDVKYILELKLFFEKAGGERVGIISYFFRSTFCH